MICRMGGNLVKRFTIGLFILLFMLQGCTNENISNASLPFGDRQSQNTVSTISIENAKIPFLFYDDDNHFDYAYSLCYFLDKKYQAMDTLLYNDKYSSEFIGSYEKVQTPGININNTFTFYNEKGISIEERIKQLYCGGDVIDGCAHVNAELESTQKLKGNRWIGFDSSQNPYPRKPTYSNNSIKIDLDDDGQTDTIRWSFTEVDSVNNIDTMYDYNVTVELNGTSYTYTNPTELPLKQSDLSIFVADINSDNRMEIVIYHKLMMLQSEIVVYEVTNCSIQTMFEYVIQTGP